MHYDVWKQECCGDILTNFPLNTLYPRINVKEKPNDVSQYVTCDFQFIKTHGLGNQLFIFASIIYVSQLTGRQPAINGLRDGITIERVFQLNVEHYKDMCPCYTVNENQSLAYEQNIKTQVLNNTKTISRSIIVSGFRQSWRYAMPVERLLRDHFVFRKEIRMFVEEFLRDNVPSGWNEFGFIRVGIHVRRGDVTIDELAKRGYTVPSAAYFNGAMKYFTDRHSRVQFVVASNDYKWTRQNVAVGKHHSSVSVIYSVGHSSGQDLAILSSCDHVIMSTGTFGWWAAWLANGTTIYYSEWPRKGSELENEFVRQDFFPTHWIPMTN